MSKTILDDCPFCLNKTICSCCGQCINRECNYNLDNPKFSEMQDWYFYQRLVNTYSRAKIPVPTYEEYLADREKSRNQHGKLLP